MLGDPAILFQTIINGLLVGGVYGISALGLTLVWGIMDIVNLAHGEFMVLGAFLCFFLFSGAGVSPVLAALLALPLGLALGLLLYWAFVHRVVGRPPLASLLLMFGVSLFLNNTMLNLWSPDTRSVPWYPGSLRMAGATIPGGRLVAFCMAGALAGALYLFLYRTYPGKAIRAIMQDREASAAMGVDTQRILLLCFGVGTALAVVAGTLLAMVRPFAPQSAVSYAVIGFVVVVAGGLGNPFGALLGGLLVGLVESATGTYISQTYTPVVVSCLLVGFLLLRPAGLFGRTLRAA
ncbi:MAG TPA: branched-chain amino acid ABC transporter permease [Candidatus Sulfotelmatobacter sp.]|nr:branched-chain amino acid ABC transporter permease [Candidatus Sulfotelmatobacter sp.]